MAKQPPRRVMGKAPPRRNPVARTLKAGPLKPKVVAAKKGKGSYVRRPPPVDAEDG